MIQHYFQIRFVRGTGWDSRVIEWGTRSWTSHVEEFFPGIGKTFGAMLNGGVIYRGVSDKQYRNVSHWEAWRLPIRYDQYLALCGFRLKCYGLPYNWKAIVSFACGERDWRDSNSWFCSEYIVRAMEVMGIVRLPLSIPTDRITPRDAYLIFTGLLGVERLEQLA